MNRFGLVLKNEIKLFRTTIPIHVIAFLQPTVMYILMATILVHPTFDMYINPSTTSKSKELVAAMKELGSPVGSDYINPVIIDQENTETLQQVVYIEETDGQPLAIQVYGLIDSNMVKNFRNRLTAAALRLWNESLGNRAIQIKENPQLPLDMPYTLFFGMAMLPLAATFAASITGAFITAQQFENGTILEYRLSPVSSALVIGARLIRLIITGLVSASVLLGAIRLMNNVWPVSIWRVGLILIPVSLVASCIGICAGLAFRKAIPAFLVGLVISFFGWIIGSGFGLAAGFGKTYTFISHLVPNTHAVELLFPLFFDGQIGNPMISILYMIVSSSLIIGITMSIYQHQVKGNL